MIGNTGVSALLVILFVASPLGVLFYMVWLNWTRGREPQQGSIAVQYEPPNNLTPAECGALVDNAVALRCITATITDLSVKGYLTIEQKENSDSPGAHKDYVFHLKKPLTESGNLKPHERRVLTSIFFSTNPLELLSQSLEELANAEKAAGHAALSGFTTRVEQKAKEVSEQYKAVSGFSDAARDSVEMSNLQDHFALHLAEIRDAIFDRLVADGYYGSRPDRIRMNYGASGVFLGVLMAVAGGVLAGVAGTDRVPLILTGLAAGAIIFGFGWFLPARTSAGAQTFAKILGFRQFLIRVEKDHIERLEKAPELFEKYLPYAMALAVENNWTQAFATITVAPPQWYQGKRRDRFLPMHLTNDMNQMSGQAGPAHS